MKRSHVKMKSAWLITWEWIGEHAAVDKKIVAVINYRRSSSYIKDMVEQFYISIKYNTREKAACAKDSHANPYPAHYGNLRGVPWHGRITCGHNPYLYARLVSNVRLERKGNDSIVVWDERPIPNPSEW